MTEIKLNSTTQSLLDQVQKIYPGPVIVRFGDQKAGFIRHDQAQQEALGDGLQITITDITAPDYTASHELLHLLMLLQGFPQIFFQVSFANDPQLDEQLMIMSTDLYDIAMHLVVVKEQRSHGLIDDQIEQLYLKGILETLTRENGQKDNERTLRLITLLDALVFYGDHIDQYESDLIDNYPVAYEAAKDLYQQLTAKEIDSPFAMRRAIVKLYKQFDTQLAKWGLPALHNNEFVTLSSVLSERQLRLEVRQLFEIFHSDMIDKQTKKQAYIGLNKTDQQNSFVIAPETDDTAAFFKKYYSKTVQDLFEDMEMPYIIRK